MNVYKSLDILFPTLESGNRHGGEVVDIDITVYADGVELGSIAMKRKQWYVNASVNAFLLHRHLVREFCGLNVHGTPGKTIRRAKRLIALAVLCGYLENYRSGKQYHTFSLAWETKGTFGKTGPAMWYLDLEKDEATEVVDDGEALVSQVRTGVIRSVAWEVIPMSFIAVQ